MEDFSYQAKSFLFLCKSKNLSDKTISWYSYILESLMAFLCQENLDSRPRYITKAHLRAYLAYLQTKPIVNNLSGKVDKVGLSSHSLKDHFSVLKIFFGFLEEEGYIAESPLKKEKPPRQEKKIVETFTEAQLQALLSQPDQKTFLGLRDYAILSTLLDTGMRLSELTGLRTQDINWNENLFLVYGKGRKERQVPFSSKLKRTLWKYSQRRGEIMGQDLFFVDRQGEELSQNAIRQMLRRYGEKAHLKGVRVSPHTFRHTFAKLWILNGGDPFSLQKILGHTTMEMVRNYVNLASGDLQSQHRKFSPLDRMRWEK
ncbi:integrase/recombinase XerD [Candidatus Hakubella thermalkaliphila]|uniref:Integrase/recombinase XerD n=3 Tax=Candidatus Hakubella thermalkaliphila TaxID=2754717 RepID=A0A6V8NX23_9ACTN|nr:integrase/recombinase XerD [Candidatus Hakubella thermalkaliphila]GFP26943.1 integrase/recombinase XerD [Candidatus Hakubella thermalkaliphila]GFP41260.1 integrase/recombinase XerD [Candidatus Hakubella thermalkaliphila]